MPDPAVIGWRNRNRLCHWFVCIYCIWGQLRQLTVLPKNTSNVDSWRRDLNCQPFDHQFPTHSTNWDAAAHDILCCIKNNNKNTSKNIFGHQLNIYSTLHNCFCCHLNFLCFCWPQLIFRWGACEGSVTNLRESLVRCQCSLVAALWYLKVQQHFPKIRLASKWIRFWQKFRDRKETIVRGQW